MKIIGMRDEPYTPNKYIVEMDHSEMGYIINGNYRAVTLSCGTTVKVGPHWSRVNDVLGAQAKLQTAADNLRALAGLLDTMDVVVPPTPPKEIQPTNAE